MRRENAALKEIPKGIPESIQEEIDRGIHPFMKRLFYRIREGGRNLVMDGVWVYNENAQFVGGKVINLCSYVVTELMEGEEQEDALKALGDIFHMCSGLPMKTWGILNAITGIYRLKQKGIEKQAIAADTWERLKVLLDWRTFVDCENHMALMDLPTNYYGVAFGIARYRELLGWDEEGYSQKLLDRFMKHINRYSGECGFMDETPGQGRFDRYSILVPAELTATVCNTGFDLPEQIVTMLGKSASICLNMANKNGYGFSYGRSTGAYGDTAVLEILAAAARTGRVLTLEEEKLAYAYCAVIVRRFREFWIDEEMDSVNLWEKGRGTDSYRNKNRILSENLSLCMQIVSLRSWRNPGAEEGYLEEALKEHRMCGVKGTVTSFAHGTYERCLAVVRDEDHVWMLPVISGGDHYFQKSPYLPIPYEQFMVTGVPGVSYADLVPCLTLSDGKKVMPVAFMKEVTWQQEEQEFSLAYRQTEACNVTGETVESVEGICSETQYCWKPGEISRRDVFWIPPQFNVVSVEMEYLTFSAEPEEIAGGIRFGKGGVYEITAQGYDTYSIKAAEDSREYHTPDGRIQNHIKWTMVAAGQEDGAFSGTEERRRIQLTWNMKYR